VSSGLSRADTVALKRQDALVTITSGLSWLASQCKLQGAIHLLDTNTVAHDFYRLILNEVYGLNLAVMDRIQPNFPAIDLGDETNKRSFQITAEKKSEKIQATIDAYHKHNLVERYGKLQVIVIGDRQGTYDSLSIPTTMLFVWADDIIGIGDLIKHIESFVTEKLERIAAIIQGEIKDAPGGITGSSHRTVFPQGNPLHRIIDLLTKYHCALGRAHHADTQEAMLASLDEWRSCHPDVWGNGSVRDDTVRSMADPAKAWLSQINCRYVRAEDFDLIEKGAYILSGFAVGHSPMSRPDVYSTMHTTDDELRQQWDRQGEQYMAISGLIVRLKELAARSGSMWPPSPQAK
jgi:hypothetical protein